MADETYTFDQARARLDEIAAQVRRKDTSLEKSLDLLEEGVRLANACTEQIDQTQWRPVPAELEAAEEPAVRDEVEAADGVSVDDADEPGSGTPALAEDAEAGVA